MKENQYILDFLLQNRQNVLFFTTAQTDVIVKAACALANTHGGPILIGVNANGDVSGVKEQDISMIMMSLQEKYPLRCHLYLNNGNKRKSSRDCFDMGWRK